ncbi:MAG: Ig-like domain-containing protein [Solobacterium sp.]|nr:Ig-like domain-containing protein [Solobacterium sp.]
MLKKGRRISNVFSLFLALMLAVPQGITVYAEDIDAPEETAPEITEEVEEYSEPEEVLTLEEETETEEETITEENSDEEEEEIVEETEEEPEENEDDPEEPEVTPESETVQVFLTLSETDVELHTGESFTFDAVVSGTEEEVTVVWSTDNPAVISVDDHGTVTALQEGIAYVKAAVPDTNVSADAMVKVISSEEAQITFEDTSYEVAIGETITIPYELAEGEYEDIVWTFSSDVASVNTDTEGEITVEGVESGVMLATAEIDGVSKSVGVVVLADEDPEYEAIRLLGDAKAETIINASYAVSYRQSSARDLAQQLNYYRWNTAQINTINYDYTVERYAMQRAAELAVYFSNERPDGSSWHTIFDKSVYGQMSSSNLNEVILSSGNGGIANGAQALQHILADSTNRTRSLRKSTKCFGVGHAALNGIDYWVLLFSDWPAANTSQTAAVDWDESVNVKISSRWYSSPTFTPSKTLVKVNVKKKASLPSITGKINVPLAGKSTNISFTGYSVSWSLAGNAGNYAKIITENGVKKIQAKDNPNNNETVYIHATPKLNGKTYSDIKIQLKVIQPVTGVKVAPTTAELHLGRNPGEDKVTLTETVLPDNATDKSVTWKSSNTKVATVSSKGVVTAKKGGTCTITVTTNDGGFKATSKITVKVHATSIAFEFTELTMTEGMSDILVPVFTPAGTTETGVKFTSSDTSKATIDNTGRITALQKNGDTPVTITVTSQDNPNLKAELPVTIKDKDQVKKASAYELYESEFEFPLFEYDEDEYVNPMLKGDKIKLHSDTKDAVLYYTLDGTDPTTNSTQYTGMITYSGGNVTLKVLAVKPPQLIDSEIAEFRIEESSEPTWDIAEEDLEKLWDEEEGVYHIPAELWAAGIDESVTYTGGKITFPDIRVYYRHYRLEPNKDYKISYKNNVNVCPEGTKGCTVTYKEDGSYVPAKNTKVPYVKITGKGNYKGNTYAPFKIEPAVISEEYGFSYKSDLYVSLGTKAVNPVPVILWNRKKLKNKTDYVIAYSRNAEGTDIIEGGITEAGEYWAIISGIKNYTSDEHRLAVPIHVRADALLLGKATIKVANVEWTGEPVDPDTLNITVKSGKTLLEKGTDYVIDTASWLNPKEIGTYEITIKAPEGSQYIGEKTGTFKITGKSIAKTKIRCLGTSVTFTGNSITLGDLFKADPTRPDLTEVTLFDGDKKLTEWQPLNPEDPDTTEGTGDYIVQVSGKNKGKGTIKITGKGNYSGTITKKFTIKPRLLKKEDVFIYLFDMNFSKSGARPEVFVFLITGPDDPNGFEFEEGYYGRYMEPGRDYSLKFFNNKKIYTDDTYATKNPPSVSVIFKGNYKGTNANNHFLIQTEDISYMRINAADKVYATSNKGSKNYIKPTIYDYEGKKLTLNKDYTLTYYYAQDAKVNGSTTYNRAYGTPIRATDVPEPGTVIAVEATGKGSYYGTLRTEYKVIKKATNLSSAKVTVNYQNGKNKFFEYTGGQIIPTAENLKVTLSKKTLVYGVDFEIKSITNNIKAGKATMVLRGIGDYGGTKKVTFSIGKQSLVLDLNNLIHSMFGLDD